MSTPTYLDLGPDRRIAHVRTKAQGAGRAAPGVVFLGGFRSDMEGTKALALEAWARREGHAFLRFDYRGHGASSGAFEDGCVGDWADDAIQAVTRLTEGPQVVVGSSMGGWIALLLARAAPARVAALVGVAAAPDFTVEMAASMNEAARAEMAATGLWRRPSAYSDDPYPITRKLIEDGARNLVLDAPLRVGFPVRLLQGTADEDVSVDVAMRLLGHVEGPDTRLTLVKGADHRFSGAREIDLLIATVEEAGLVAQKGISSPE
ncbi:alpha/beta hydrolase [Pikeienuella piscinae]|uniref:Palmitoyl-protein thioesterase ABHD10, mitochondrial n=1 Tax=Pikeienuella piscinae TaxID=2748098 RepID=A0A7L5C0L9_9RHOB|nr:alpha/beta hydrolase [Pikeienuella piscinae]QIE56933.1 alpha/beta hydrolase [Pikeienuella piscinae]